MRATIMPVQEDVVGKSSIVSEAGFHAGTNPLGIDWMSVEDRIALATAARTCESVVSRASVLRRLASKPDEALQLLALPALQ